MQFNNNILGIQNLNYSLKTLLGADIIHNYVCVVYVQSYIKIILNIMIKRLTIHNISFFKRSFVRNSMANHFVY